MLRVLSRFRLALPLLLLALGSSVLVQAQQAGNPARDWPGYTGVSQVALQVLDLERSQQFYTRLFGREGWRQRDGEAVHFKLGDSVLTLLAHGNAGTAYVGFGLETYDAPRLTAFLEHQALSVAAPTTLLALRVDDHRNAMQIRLTPRDYAEHLRDADETVELEEVSTTTTVPIFQALSFDELFLTVTDLEVDSLFYARLLNQAGTLQAGSLWYTLGKASLRVTQAPVGQTPGVNYFAVLVSATDLNAAANAIFDAGGIIETLLPNGFTFWDPDGNRVLVRTTLQVLDKSWSVPLRTDGTY